MTLEEYFYSLLAQVCTTVYAFPQNHASFPLFSFYQKGGSVEQCFHGEERLVRYTFRVDLWDQADTPQRLLDLAEQGTAVLAAAGFRRRFTADIPEKAGFFHRAMEFTCLVDTKTGAIYQN